MNFREYISYPLRVTSLPVYQSINMSVHVQYHIIPPVGVQLSSGATQVPPQGTIDISLEQSHGSHSRTASHYANSSAAIRQLQIQLNDALTPWKDAIGDKEKAKETVGVISYGNGRASRLSRLQNETAASSGSDDDSV
jgi:hypothetical protein